MQLPRHTRAGRGALGGTEVEAGSGVGAEEVGLTRVVVGPPRMANVAHHGGGIEGAGVVVPAVSGPMVVLVAGTTLEEAPGEVPKAGAAAVGSKQP